MPRIPEPVELHALTAFTWPKRISILVHWLGPDTEQAGFPPDALKGDTAILGEMFWTFDGVKWTTVPPS